jgi:RHS repeat-associated protein
LKQVVNSVPTTYTQDLAAPLVTALTERTGATTKQYVYGLGDSPLAVYSGTTWTYLSGRDGLNSVRQETDASGNVITERRFDPYGVPLSGNGGTPFGYTGEAYDASTQLVFLRARYMQPTLGVFLSRDPWRGDTLRPLTYNGWDYVEGNPTNVTDPNGDCAGCAVGALAKVVGANQAGQGGLAFRSHPDYRAPTIFPHRLPDGTLVTLLSNAFQGQDGLPWRWVSLFTMPTRTGFASDNYLDRAFGSPPPPPGPGGTLPSINFGFNFTGWPVTPQWYQPFGPSIYAYCTAGLRPEEKNVNMHPECQYYFGYSNQYGALHGLHNGVDFGAGDGTAVKWTANQRGTVASIDTLPDANPNIVIEVGNYWVIFGHTVPECISNGGSVNPGDTIGKTDNVNKHLHLGIVPKNDYSYYLNPASAFMPNADSAFPGNYAPGKSPIKAFRAGADGDYWLGTYTPEY